MRSVKASKRLFQDFESQIKGDVDQVSISSNDSEEEIPDQMERD